MEKFKTSNLADLFSQLSQYFQIASYHEPNKEISDADRKWFLNTICLNAPLFCRDMDLPESFSSLIRFSEALKNEGLKMTYSELIWTLHNLIELIKSEASKRLIFIVPNELKQYFNNDKLFGEKIKEGFPSASEDLKEAGNCLAFGNNTACVFHLMRVVEWGLRALCENLKIKTTKKTKLSGRIVHIPISYSEWDHILTELDAKINEFSQMKRGKKKQLAQEIYLPMILDVRAIKDAWRNHCMHARVNYNYEHALMIFSHVKHLFNALASQELFEI